MSTAALEDSQSALSAHVPALSSRIVQDLSESCFSYLKSALEVPRLYRRTNKVSAPCGESSVVCRARELWALGRSEGALKSGAQEDLESAASTTHSVHLGL